MRIVISGGTGFIGRGLCAALATYGHEVTVLSRRSGPGRVRWDGVSAGNWQEALEGAEAVINLSGESVADGRWTRARKDVLRESRILPVRALVRAMGKAKARPKVFLCASAVGYYGDRGDEELDESASAGSDFLARLCADWECEAAKAAETGARTASLRIGVVLGPGGGALAKMLPPFKLGLGGPLGNGRQWMSWISREDLAGLTQHLLRSEISGAVNAVAPNPVTNKDFSSALGRALGRPAFLAAPAFALRLALGEMAEMLLGGQKVRPARALAAGYRFKHPDLASALAAAL